MYVFISAAAAAISVILWFALFRYALKPVTAKSYKTLLKLKIEGDDGSLEYMELPEAELQCGFSPESDIQLAPFTKPPSGKSRNRPDEIIITPSAKGLMVKAPGMVMINGVSAMEGLLKEGGILRYGSCKIVYTGIEVQESEEVSFRSKAEVLKKSIIPSALTAAALLFLLMHLLKELPVTERAPAATAEPAAAATAAVEPELPAAAAAAAVTSAESAGLSFPLMIGPGSSLSGEKADILFIHAHPDDESLDFGTLLALSRKAGLRTAVLLLTDGEEGIIRQDYTGSREDIASVRVQEAAEAIGILGGLYYIRFGFKNHPYNTLSDRKKQEEVLAAWGGKIAAARQIADVIKTLRPDIVVSPDRPSRANEHFEHEAAGTAAALSLEILADEGGFIPSAHLVSVDPRQQALYTDLTAFPRKVVREVQKEALLSHRTQADASVFGIKMIEDFDFEYYSVKYWRLDDSPEKYVSP